MQFHYRDWLVTDIGIGAIGTLVDQFPQIAYVRVASSILRSYVAVILVLSSQLTPFLARSAIAAQKLPAIDYREVEKSACDYRRDNLVAGMVVLEVVPLNPPERQARAYRYKIAFDEDKLRFDSYYLPPEKVSDEWRTYRRYIYADGRVIAEESTRSNIAVIITRRGEHAPGRGYVFHPRALGFSNGGILNLGEKGLHTLLLRSDRSEPVVESETSGKIPHYVIRYQLKGGGSIKVSVSPSQGFSVAECEFSITESDGTRIQQSTTSELLRYPGGVWYPKKCEYQLLVDDRLVNREVITVKEAVFDEPVDPSLFTLSGLNLKEGRSIVDHTRDYLGGLTWDGAEIVANVPQTLPSVELTPSPRRNALLLLNAAVCALLALWLLARRFRASRQAAG